MNKKSQSALTGWEVEINTVLDEIKAEAESLICRQALALKIDFGWTDGNMIYVQPSRAVEKAEHFAEFMSNVEELFRTKYLVAVKEGWCYDEADHIDVDKMLEELPVRKRFAEIKKRYKQRAEKKSKLLNDTNDGKE